MKNLILPSEFKLYLGRMCLSYFEALTISIRAFIDNILLRTRVLNVWGSYDCFSAVSI